MARPRQLSDEERIERRRASKREYMRRYRANNLEASREYQRKKAKEYYYSRPVDMNSRRQKRWAYKARKRSATIGPVSIAKLVAEWDRICGICKTIVNGQYEIDHIIPLSRGGPHAQHNLQLAHPFCNRSKGNRI